MIKELKKTAEKLTGAQVAHMMHITDVKENDLLLFKRNQHQELVAIDTLDNKAFIGKVLSAPVKGFGGYYEFKTDLHPEGYKHHLNDLVAIVKDLLTPQQRTRAKGLVYTSADDCKVSLNFETDLSVLNEALRLAQKHEYKTKVAHIERKIRQLGKR